jgi:periplasmic mercuric ion binding protein
MKKILLALTVVTGLSLASAAQTKSQLTAKIKTPGIGCEDCKTRLHTYLDRYDGITYINVSWRKKEITVKYLTDRIDIEQIKTAISNSGYDADDVPANPDFYKRLPQTCKKPEDGGHPKKTQ